MTVADRIAWIERSNRWIKYERAQSLLSRLMRLLNAPKADRMPNLLIVGETNNGKTAILRHFESTHPRKSDPNEGVASVPVLFVQAPALSDEGRFYDDILRRLYAPFGASWNVGRRQQQAYSLMRNLDVRVLIIDDVHNLIAGASAKQRVMLNVLRHLGNELQISIVCAGIDTAFNAIESDAQLGNRFVPVALPRWKLDDPAFPALLKGFESDFRLQEASRLHEPALAVKIASMTEGTIGEIRTLLTMAAVKAIETGAERITAQLLDISGYTPPRERHRLRVG